MKQTNQKHEHLLSNQFALAIGCILLGLTGITVWVAGVDLGRFNFTVAMFIATLKALLVTLFFMNLYRERRENAIIFASSFVFLAIFLGLTATDSFFRGDREVKGPLELARSGGDSKLKKPWISTPELIAQGKQIFAVQCVSCHGAEGRGDGPAMAALNPKPRNFHDDSGWKKVRKPTLVFQTLTEGLPPSAMAAYATLPADERWALTHYVLSLGSAPQPDTLADFKLIEVDPSKETGGMKVAETIPIEFAIERMSVPDLASEPPTPQFYQDSYSSVENPSIRLARRPHLPAGAAIYRDHCMRCHGQDGQGGVRIQNLGVISKAFYVTQPLRKSVSEARFNEIVIQGLSGGLMPGIAHFSDTELKELYQFFRTLKTQLGTDES